MTEPRVEAGDRALEFTEEVFTEHNPTLVANWTARLAALIQSAMNAQERELDQLLPDSLNRPMSERIQGLKERADREANLAVELREALRKLRNEVSGILGLERYRIREVIGNTNMVVLQQRLDEAERLLAERGDTK